MARLRALPPRLGKAPSRWPKVQKQPDPHYNTPEHRAWSTAVKERAGWRCEDCGATGVKLYADHVVELKDGGDPFGQGHALCASCHGRKTADERARRFGV